MSTTFKIQDGQMEYDASGQPIMVEGEAKCAQDMGESQLQDYFPEQDYGSFLRAVVNQRIPGVTELVLRQFIADSIHRLENKQVEDPASTPDERISSIDILNTVLDDEGNAAYYVKCSTESAASNPQTTVFRTPTSFNQLFEGF